MTKDEMTKALSREVFANRDIKLGDIMVSLHSKIIGEEHRETLARFEDRLFSEWNLGNDNLLDQSDELIAFVYQILVKNGYETV